MPERKKFLYSVRPETNPSGMTKRLLALLRRGSALTRKLVARVRAKSRPVPAAPQAKSLRERYEDWVDKQW